MVLDPGTQLGPYVLGGVIGRGGMGEVFEGRDTRLGRRVAIKTLRRGALDDEQARRRLQREASAISALNHPNVCTIFDVGRHDAVDFIVMEYIEGDTLASVLARGSLTESEVVRIGAQIAEALAEAHERGILHRDIKPQNVMITPRGQAKVLDFGLARSITAAGEPATAGLSDTGQIAGTVGFMSPEQARGEPLDGRTDLFSLGCLLYTALANRPPFDASSPIATVSAILTGEPPPLAEVAPSTSAELRRIVRKCLEKDRSRRYQSARDLANDLRNLLEASPAASAAITPPLRAKSTIGRRRVIAAAAAVLLVAAAAAWRWRASTPAAPGRPVDVRSVAVLPFKPLVTTDENYVGVGIADGVISRISGGALTVRPTSAVRKYAADTSDALSAGRELQVDVVLDGTWQRDAQRFRVSVNLLRVADGASLWANRFDVAAADVFAIQDRVADELAARLRLEVDAARGAAPGAATRSAEAYEAYLRGVFHLAQRGYDPSDRADIDTAIRFLERAAALDPDYSEAHAKLGFAYAHRAVFIDTDDREQIERAVAATARAERAGPELAQAHLTRALILWSWYEGWQIVESIRAYRRAERLDPAIADIEISSGYAHLGLLDDWRRVGERVIAADPTNRRARETFVNEHYLLNLPEEGRAAQQRLLGSDPAPSYYVLTGRTAEAAPHFETQAASGVWSQAWMAILRAQQGRHQEAQAIAARLAGSAPRNRGYHHITYNIARVYALGGDAAQAARWLEETIAWGFPCYPIFSTDRMLDPVRSAPAVRKVLGDLKVTWEGYRAALQQP